MMLSVVQDIQLTRCFPLPFSVVLDAPLTARAEARICVVKSRLPILTGRRDHACSRHLFEWQESRARTA